MHDPVEQTGKWLKSVMQGYSNYHAVPGNLGRLRAFHRRVQRLWRWTLCRRGQPHRPFWAKILRLMDRWLPIPRVVHPYPGVRFAAKIRTVCAGERPYGSLRGGRATGIPTAILGGATVGAVLGQGKAKTSNRT